MSAKDSNIMGALPIKNVLWKMGTPMIISMMLQAVYNIVDSAFVSNMPENGELALNALTLSFPVQVMMIAFGIGTGVGMNAILSRTIGEGDKEKASHIAGNGIFLGIVIYIAFLLFGIFGVDAFLGTQTTNEVILSMGHTYLTICCTLSFGNVFFAVFEKLLQATSLSMYSTIAQISGAITNIILDPILIYGLLGLPKMGVAGAAYATVIGQVVSVAVALFFHVKKNHFVNNGLKYLKPDGKIIGHIYSIGVPAIIAQALMSVMTYGLNIILGMIGENVVTAYGLYYKIQQFVLFAAFGLRDAITPITSFNYGMGSKKRVNEAVRYGLTDTLIIMAIGTILMEIIANPLSAAFGLSGETQSICISAIRIISLSFILAGANVAFQGIFQALDGGLESLVVSALRQLILVLPIAYGFAMIAINDSHMLPLVWLTFLIAEGLSCVVSIFFFLRIKKKKINALEG